MCVCGGGFCLWIRGGYTPGQTLPWTDTSPSLRRPLQWTLRVLLQCILVWRQLLCGETQRGKTHFVFTPMSNHHPKIWQEARRTTKYFKIKTIRIQLKVVFFQKVKVVWINIRAKKGFWFFTSQRSGPSLYKNVIFCPFGTKNSKSRYDRAHFLRLV